ncbi:MAG: phosphatidate cytidylyltransferase [Pirellulaceae bacterium]|nr:phosphatidate cytidylyltransferase [Pirellulaceae bacterium]
MLRSRLLSASILISCTLVFVGLDAWASGRGWAGVWLLPLGIYLIFGSAYECVAMIGASSLGSVAKPALLGCACVMSSACAPIVMPLLGMPYPGDCLLGPLGMSLAAAGLALVGCCAWYIPSYEPGSGVFQRAVLAGWISCYFGICFAFLLALRLVGEPSWGLYLVVGLIVVTKLSDTGAYFVGRSLGRTKLCPRVSPNKTVEGLVGGMLAACLAAWIYFGLCAPWAFGSQQVAVSWQGVLALGVGLTLVGLAGDLMQSIFKREMGCKDSGRLLPGLGGLWDVTDSLLPAAVAGYAIIASGWIRGPGQ